MLTYEIFQAQRHAQHRYYMRREQDRRHRNAVRRWRRWCVYTVL